MRNLNGMKGSDGYLEDDWILGGSLAAAVPAGVLKWV